MDAGREIGVRAGISTIARDAWAHLADSLADLAKLREIIEPGTRDAEIAAIEARLEAGEIVPLSELP